MPVGTTIRFPYTVSVQDNTAYTVDVEDLTNYRLIIYNPKTSETLYAGGGETATIDVYQGDVGRDLQFTVNDPDDDAVNLTDGTVTLRVAKGNAASLKVAGDCTLTSPTNGRCVYTTIAADLDTCGEYEAQLYIEVASKKITIAGIILRVNESLPKGD